MFQKNCELCQKDFSARRRIDIYCSSACRVEGVALKARIRAAKWREAHPERAKQAVASWREENLEKARQAVKAWHKSHPQERRQHRAKWRAANAEIIKATKARWNQAHPENGVAYQQRRRVLKVSNGGSFTPQEWQQLKRRYGYRCLCCGYSEPKIKLVVDHVVALAAGGSNDIANVQPLCRRCNGVKGTKTIDYRTKS